MSNSDAAQYRTLIKMRRYTDTQRILGARWPHNEYVMKEIHPREWHLVLVTPSDFIKPHFTDAQLRIEALIRELTG